MGKDIKIDISGLKQLQKNFAKLSVKALNDFTSNEINMLGADLIARCIDHTPVKSGNLRRNWKKGRPTKISDGKKLEVYNDLFYASYVNDGHIIHKADGLGWYEGQHFIEGAVEEYEGDVNGILEKDLKQYLERKLNGDN